MRLIWFLAACTFFVLAWNYGADLNSSISINYNEGPLLDQAMRLTRGEAIYSPDLTRPPYIISNYGPVYHLLQYPFLKIFGPSMFFGRLISVAAHLSSAWFVSLIVIRLTGNRDAGMVGGLVLLASPVLGAMLPLYKVDAVAQALSLAGICAALGRRRMLSVLCFTAAIYTKQTYGFAGPAAIFLYSWFQDKKREAFLQAALLAAVALAIFAVADAVTHGGFYFHLVTANINNYSLAYFIHYAQGMLLASVPALLLIGKTRKLPLFMIIYLGCACVSAFAVGKMGSNYNYFSEFETAVALLFGAAFALSERREYKNLLLAAQVLLYLTLSLQFGYYRMLHDDTSAYVHLQKIIAAESGPVLSDEYMGMIALSGKPLYFQPFEMQRLLESGHWSQKKFVVDLNAHAFPLIVMEDSPLMTERWTPEMLLAIHQHYYLAERLGAAVLWRPKQ